MAWPKSKVQLLTELWNKGYTRAEIAEKIDGATIFNVSGKILRLIKTGVLKERRKEKATHTAPTTAGIVGKPWRRKYHRKFADEYVPDAEGMEPVPLAITLLKLSEVQCKWPDGTRNYLFCGHRRKEKSPYCEYHSKIAFRPKVPKKRRV